MALAGGSFGKQTKYLNVEFSSQQGFTYSYSGVDFGEETDAKLELAYASCFVRPLHILIEIGAASSEQADNLFQVGKVKLHPYAAHGHFAKICAHVPCTKTLHVRLV